MSKPVAALLILTSSPDAVKSSLVASSEDASEYGGGSGGGGGGGGGGVRRAGGSSFSSVVRVTYCETTVIRNSRWEIAAGTSLNAFLALSSDAVLNTSAIYENGVRQN